MTEKSLIQKAKGELEKAVRIDPSLLEARILLAKLYLADQ
jgi:Tfp pilus assembly protein PilF